MYSQSDPRNETTNEARTQVANSVRSQLENDVAKRIDATQLASETSQGVKSISSSTGVSVGAVADRARPILEAEAAARGIKLTHADLDKFENSLRGMVSEAATRKQKDKPEKELSPNARTRQGMTTANAEGNSLQNADSQISGLTNPISQSLSSGALFSNSQSQSSASPITRSKAGPKLSHVMAEINGSSTENSSSMMSPVKEAIALEVGKLGRNRAGLSVVPQRQSENAPTLAAIDEKLREQIGALLDDKIKGPLSRNMNAVSSTTSTHHRTNKSDSLNWARSAAQTSSGSFGTYVRDLASV